MILLTLTLYLLGLTMVFYGFDQTDDAIGGRGTSVFLSAFWPLMAVGILIHMVYTTIAKK